MHHLQSGQQAKVLAPLLGICRQTIGSWLSRLRDHGIDGLYDRPRSGAPTHLSREREVEFVQEVIELQNQREGGRLRGVDIRALLKEKYHCHYTEGSIYTLLKRLKLSWVTGRSMHPEANLQKQEAFKKTSEKR